MEDLIISSDIFVSWTKKFSKAFKKFRQHNPSELSQFIDDINVMYELVSVYWMIYHLIYNIDGKEITKNVMEMVVERLKWMENIISINPSFDKSIFRKISDYITCTKYYEDMPVELLDRVRKAKIKMSSMESLKIDIEDVKTLNYNLIEYERVYQDMITLKF